MTYQFMLDTNIISDLVKHPQGLIFQYIAIVGENNVVHMAPFDDSTELAEVKLRERD